MILTLSSSGTMPARPVFVIGPDEKAELTINIGAAVSDEEARTLSRRAGPP
ncbi:unannotated protein [freshwater metagenome]|uniref:Unannotated protein n=1 Tax=freshwater metagenome TaxID=449393 RepID=A0A6J6DAV4_9ZZZZ